MGRTPAIMRHSSSIESYRAVSFCLSLILSPSPFYHMNVGGRWGTSSVDLTNCPIFAGPLLRRVYHGSKGLAYLLCCLSSSSSACLSFSCLSLSLAGCCCNISGRRDMATISQFAFSYSVHEIFVSSDILAVYIADFVSDMVLILDAQVFHLANTVHWWP